jgi:hypothetical protein
MPAAGQLFTTTLAHASGEWMSLASMKGSLCGKFEFMRHATLIISIVLGCIVAIFLGGALTFDALPDPGVTYHFTPPTHY